MRCRRHLITLSLLLAALPGAALATPMVYTPVNPDFGGNPFNGSVLMGVANAQNQYSAKQNPITSTQSASQLFQSALVSQLEQQIYTSISNKETGTTTVGDVTVSYHLSGDGTYEVVTLIGPTGTTVVNIPVH